MFSSSYTIDTNRLYLEITNVANGLAYLNLHNGTNQIYSVWGTSNLLAEWNVEAELWPTNQPVMSFTVPTSSRDSLFLRAEDWTGVDSDGDGVPDWWIWKYFGDLSETATNLDANGNTIGYDYTNNVVPNTFNFSSIEVANNYANSSSASAQLDVSGTPYYIAISVDDTNYAADAVWNACLSSNITINLGSTEGWHEIWIGLRGHADDPSAAIWKWKRLKLDLTPPQLVITGPTNNIVMQPMIQLTGYSPEALESISYDITNALGLLTNQQALITDQSYSTNTWEFTANYFQCYDVPLTNGVNTITLHAVDLAGNVATASFSFTLDYSGKTNPPLVQIAWPQDGMQITASNFTCRGLLDDPTAIVTAQIVNTNGDANTFNGLVERNGKFWVEDLPLSGGTNRLTLTVTDAAGNTTVTNVSLVKSDLVFAMNPVTPDSKLWERTVNLTGVISDPSYAVWVNGVKGTNYGNGTWEVDNVPVNQGGTANFDMTAYAPGEPQPSGGGN